MKRVLKSHTALVMWRVALLYVVLMLCRVVFYIYNHQLLGDIASAEVGPLIAGALKFDTVSLLYANAVFILLSLLPLPQSVRESGWWQKMLYGYYVVVNALLLVVVNIADAIYFRYAQKRFTADEIFFADNDNSLQLVAKFAIENWSLVLIGGVLIALLAVGYLRRVKPSSPLRGIWYYACSTVLLLLAVALSIGGIRGGFTKMTRPITLSNASLYTADNARAMMILSNPFCVLRTMSSSGKLHYERYFDEQTLAQIYSPEHFPSPERAATELTGRNVVIFIMESFSAEHSYLLRPDLYEESEQKGYTPFLDSLMRQSYTFYNMYSNGKRSIQALPAVWSSIPSFKSSFVLMPQSMAQTRALPQLLKEEGYQTMFFCGSDSGSMGFGAYARSVGIEQLFSRQDYEAERGKGDFDGYWGIWDDKFLDYMAEKLDGATEPFFASIFTLSSHHPFVVPEGYESGLKQELTKNHRCVKYVDDAFRSFFARAEKQEWFNNTVFLFVADHVSSEKFSEAFRHSPADYQVMGFMYAPESALMGEHYQAVSQIDLMPTLLGLMGYNKPYFAFGRDIFSEHRDQPFAINYESGLFQAITQDYLVEFDEKSVVGVYAVADVEHSENLVSKVEMATLERDVKALLQSYYSRLEQKNYLTGEPPIEE